LNYLSQHDAYLVGTMDNPRMANLKVLIPRILLLARVKPDGDASAIVKSLSQTLKSRPLEVARSSKRELKKVGGDMFFFLALENMRSISSVACSGADRDLAIALTNYLEDRRT